MTISITLPDETSRQAVAARFADHDAVRSAVAAAGAAMPVLSFAHLYDYASGAADADGQIDQALHANPRLRADLRALLAKVALNTLPEVAAASSGDLESRETDQCRIRIEPSRAEADQVYVIIELVDPSATMPRVLFTCTTDDRSDRIDLPEGRDGVIQVLLDRSAPVLTSLRDHKAEVYLR